MKPVRLFLLGLITILFLGFPFWVTGADYHINKGTVNNLTPLPAAISGNIADNLIFFGPFSVMAATTTTTSATLEIEDEYPERNDNNFPVDSAITFCFDERVMENTVSNSSVYLERYDSTGKISAKVDYDQANNQKVTLKPSKSLEYGTKYRVVVTGDITDVSGNAFVGDKWTFTTVDREGTLIISKDPTPDELNVPPDQPITFRFSTRMDKSTIDEDTVYLRRQGSSSHIDATVVYDENTRTVTLTPDESLLLNTVYTVYLSSRIEDYSSDRIKSTSWNFTTGDYQTSRIQSREPAPNQQGVSLDTRIKIRFTEDMKGSTIKSSSIYLRKAGYTGNIKCDISYNSSNREVTLAPQDSLLPDTNYTVYISSKVEDSSGNKLSPISWNFTTEDSDRLLIYRSPEIGAFQVPIDTQIIVGYTVPLTANTVNSTNCYVTYLKNNVYGPTRLPTKVSYNSSDRQIIIKPAAKLTYNTEYTVTISDRVKDYTGIFINGSTWSFTTASDPTPQGTIDRPLVKVGTEYIRSAYMKNNRTMVPYRDILEALGASVNWNGSQQKVSATLKNNTTELYIGKKTGYKNGTSVSLEVAPELRNGRTMIPLRFISEALGKKVKWDENTCTVTIQ